MDKLDSNYKKNSTGILVLWESMKLSFFLENDMVKSWDVVYMWIHVIW